ncbi:MAG: hypothetical protein V3W44_02185 [Dehalococcoidales bacterium]
MEPQQISALLLIAGAIICATAIFVTNLVTAGMGDHQEPEEDGKLSVYWSDEYEQLMFRWPTDKSDAHLLYSVFCGIGDGGPADELQSRGFDITTLRFEIKRGERE